MSLDSAVNNLVSRLEAVTKRLESVEKQLASGPAPASHAPSGGSSSGEGSSVAVQEYEDLISQFINPFVDLSNKLGDKVLSQQTSLVLSAVQAQKELINIATQSKKPADSAIQNLLKPTSDLMTQITGLKDSNRTSKFFNHLSAVAEGVQALGWVVVAPTPGPYVADMRGGSEFYSNRILKEFKGNDQTHVDWVTHFNNFLKELQVYIKKHHTTGLAWNPRGGDAPSAISQGGAPPPPPAGPPPPPPVDFASGGGSSGKGGAPDMSGVFAALNKGEGVTSGLKKVTDDQKTKNRKDKTSVVPAIVKETKETKSSAPAKVAAKPPKFGLEGNKWVVENQVNNKDIVISETEMRHTVYIYRCTNSTIQVKGKINSISMDECKKVAVVFENVVSSFEMVNCTGVEVQVTGKVPSFAIDKTSGCQLYLSKDAMDTEIVTSKSSEMNVSFADQSDELVEYPIPEQYKTVVKNYKLHTEIVQHV